MRRTWPAFLGQVVLIGVFVVANEWLLTVLAIHGAPIGLANARRIVQLERAHGFWVEPAWQLAFRQDPRLLGLHIYWDQSRLAFNVIYSLGHLCITIIFAIWIFYFRTHLFSLVRNIIFIASALAFAGYRLYPLAPPRLAPVTRYNGRPFQFVDTLSYWAGGKGSADEFAAMPSIHICYALIVGLTLAWTLRPLPLRILALLYPVLMLVTVVVTANHYLMDAVGAVPLLAIAVLLALGLHWVGPWRRSLPAAMRTLRPSRVHGFG